MNIHAIEIHAGEPEFPYTPLRRLEARSEARTAFSNAPDSEAVDMQLRQLAASIGADAVINVQYDRGISRTSWNALKASGLAVQRVKDDMPCPNCAETIKRAAKVCRFCGAEIPQQAEEIVPASPATQIVEQEPLKSTDNNSRTIVLILAAICALLLIGMVMTGG